jgi:hypothetical protein
MTPDRRDFLKQSGLLVVGIGAASLAGPLAAEAGQAAPGPRLGAGPYPDLDFHQLDSWIAIRADNTATFYVGKTDLGQGTGTAFRQLMADELDFAYDRTSLVMGTTDLTVDQGGSGGSRPMGGPCVAWRPKLVACCSTWHRHDSACRWPSSRSTRAWCRSQPIRRDAPPTASSSATSGSTSL